MKRRWAAAVALAALVSLPACSGASVAGDNAGLEPLVGLWRGALLLQGSEELPFALRIDGEAGNPAAVVLNGDFESPIEVVTRQGAASYTLRFVADVDSEIVAKMAPSGEELSGFWRYRRDPAEAAARGVDAVTQIPFSARKNVSWRFQRNDPTIEIAVPEPTAPAGAAAIEDLSGVWRVIEPNDGNVAGGERVSQDGERVVRESIDGSPAMEGIYRNGVLRLSLFDGFRARLVHAHAMADGTLEGVVWAGGQGGGSRPWSARRH